MNAPPQRPLTDAQRMAIEAQASIRLADEQLKAQVSADAYHIVKCARGRRQRSIRAHRQTHVDYLRAAACRASHLVCDLEIAFQLGHCRLL